MSLSRREEVLAHYSRSPRQLDVGELAEAMRTQCPSVVFAFLLGSAKDGVVTPGADVDVAVCLDDARQLAWRQLSPIVTVVEAVCGVACDLGILNRAGAVYRFEALRGRRLFVRPAWLERYAGFYSRTCREYEELLATYARQRRHRRSVA